LACNRFRRNSKRTEPTSAAAGLNHRGMGSYRLLKTLFPLAVQGTLLFTTS
jgi:hypothetical protein